MSLLVGFDVSASGLRAQRLRMDVIAENLANAQTTRGTEGGPYRRKQVVFAAAPLQGPGLPWGGLMRQLQGVRVLAVVEDQTPLEAVYDPGHPDAGPDGFVLMPNVNPATELVDMISATRSYEANAAVIEALKKMAARALDIAR